MPEKQAIAELQAVRVRFGANLKDARLRAGLSAGKLASRVPVDTSAIGQMEAGRRLPGIGILVALSTALEVSPAELLRGIKWIVPEEPGPGSFEFD